MGTICSSAGYNPVSTQDPSPSVNIPMTCLSSQTPSISEQFKRFKTKLKENKLTPQEITDDILSEVDYQWYSWEALHYAALAAEPTILKTICQKLPSNKINSLTALSENALHILLDQGKRAQWFDLSCQNGTKLTMYRIIGPEKDNVVECAKILIEAGIDINHSNFWNETPVLIAIKRKYFEIVKLLIAREGIDLDSCSTNSKKTARELLKGRMELPLAKHAESEDPKQALFRLLKAGDDEGFLKYGGGKIEEYANAFDGDSEANSSCTLLEFCFRKGLLSWYQEMQKNQHEVSYYHSDITANSIVQVFCQSGMVKCIQHLLDNKADINSVTTKFNRPLLEVAAIKGYYPLIALILGSKNITNDPNQICDIVLTLIDRPRSGIDFDNTLSILLTSLLQSGQDLDVNKLEALMESFAKGVKTFSKQNIALFLKFPGSLSIESSPGKSVLEEIDPDVIKKHLDDCVEENLADSNLGEDSATKEKEVRINYESFIKDKETGEVLHILLQSSLLNTFLNHLVLKILINRKWEHLHGCFNIKYFYLNLFFYVTFYVFLNVYVLLKFSCVDNTLTCPLLLLNWLCWIIFILKELAQIFANFRFYYKELNNYAEIALIVVSFLAYITDEVTFTVLSVLVSNLVLLLLLEQVPKLAKYIIILRTVVFYLKYLLFYLIQFLAFAICFYILFSDQNQKLLNELPNKIFETIVIFTGNLDFMDKKKFEKNELLSKLVFLLFVVFMAIILHNLLLGLLVTDMNNLGRSVKLFEQMKRASFVVRLQNFMDSKFKCLFSYDSVDKNNFDKDGKYLIVDRNDRKMLEDDDRQHLDFILSKVVKKQDVLSKLYSYIKAKIAERDYYGLKPKGQDEEVLLEKLKFFEEKIKGLQDTNEIIKSELSKIGAKL